MTQTAKLILLVIGMVLLGIMGFWILNAWQDYVRLQGMEAQWKASSQATSQTITAASTQTEEKQKVEFIITDRRAASDRRFEEVKREDQSAADWAATPIPDSVRNIDAAPPIDGTPSSGGGSAGLDGTTPSRRRNSETR